MFDVLSIVDEMDEHDIATAVSFLAHKEVALLNVTHIGSNKTDWLCTRESIQVTAHVVANFPLQIHFVVVTNRDRWWRHIGNCFHGSDNRSYVQWLIVLSINGYWARFTEKVECFVLPKMLWECDDSRSADPIKGCGGIATSTVKRLRWIWSRVQQRLMDQ